jgi:hypothetical protein
MKEWVAGALAHRREDQISSTNVSLQPLLNRKDEAVEWLGVALEM